MSRGRSSGNGPTRRSAMHAGLATAAAALVLPELLAADEAAALKLQRYDAVVPEKYPWGWIRWLMNGQIDPKAEMTMGLVHFEPNQSNVLHVHPNSAEFLHVLSGVSEHLMGDRWVTLKAGDTLRIPRGVPHQARTRDEPFQALIVYDTPNRIMVPVTDRPSK